jgi:hypothetical protein
MVAVTTLVTPASRVPLSGLRDRYDCSLAGTEMEYATGPPTAVRVNEPVYGSVGVCCVRVRSVDETVSVPGDGLGDGVGVAVGDGGADVGGG